MDVTVVVQDRRLAPACRRVHANDGGWVVRIGRNGVVLRQLFLAHLDGHGVHVEPVGPIDSRGVCEWKHVEMLKRSEVEFIED